MSDGSRRANRPFRTLKGRKTRILAQVSKLRQRGRRQDAQNHDHHNQLDQGKTRLLFHFHSPKVSGPVLSLVEGPQPKLTKTFTLPASPCRNKNFTRSAL